MNRLILIGNGFDLAHKMKTRYSDFIDWYTKTAFLTSNKNGKYDDELMTITKINYSKSIDIAAINDINYFFEFLPEKHTIVVSSLPDYDEIRNRRDFNWTFKNGFIETLVNTCYNCGWVDIENEYYNHLKKVLLLNDKMKNVQIDHLNNALRYLISKLENYFTAIEIPQILPEYPKLFFQKIEINDLLGNDLKASEDPKKILLLNFNYTNLLNDYMERLPSETTLINIHGQLNDQINPIIFGFGDELDKDYATIELQTNKQFMHFLKSFGYHMTSNYHNLVRFLNTDLYQVYILGHSCGLSDRTMLNMIFEHSNCRSIKIFYHQTDNATNNFTDLTMEISRHFHNKGETRKLIVDFTRSLVMPQMGK